MIDFEKLSLEENKQEFAEDNSKLIKIQECNAEFRKRFIEMMVHSIDSECVFNLHEGTRVKGIYRGMNRAGDLICVENLESPIGTIPKAHLRMSDVIQFRMPFKMTGFHLIQASTLTP